MSKAKQWLQNFLDKHDLSDELFELQHTAESLSPDEDGTEELYNELYDMCDEDVQKDFDKNKDKIVAGLMTFIEEMNLDSQYADDSEEEEVNESALSDISKEKLKENKEVKGVTQTPPIQGNLSNRAFKYLYSWEELRQRTIDAAWLYDQCKSMMDAGENLNEVEKTFEKLEKVIEKLAEFYRKRYEIKLGYLRKHLEELKQK